MYVASVFMVMKLQYQTI